LQAVSVLCKSVGCLLSSSTFPRVSYVLQYINVIFVVIVVLVVVGDDLLLQVFCTCSCTVVGTCCDKICDNVVVVLATAFSVRFSSFNCFDAVAWRQNGIQPVSTVSNYPKGFSW